MKNLYTEKIDKLLLRYLNRVKDKTDSNLFSAMRYALMGGGKRVRPTLMLMFAKLLGVPEEQTYPLFTAIEFIHTYSLIHDDLPAMDNDEIRRGNPTVHKVFGEGVAVLAGDALLNLAYEVLIDGIGENPHLQKACVFIAKWAGSIGMVGGQAKEFTFLNDYKDLTKDQQLDTLMEVYSKKTGGLISASIYAPFLLLPYQDSSMGKAIYQISQNVGVIFQLSDDIIDWNDGTDKDKVTVVSLLGENQAKAIINDKYKDCQNLLTPFGDNSKEILEYFAYLSHRII